jgi:hypothetical protein
MLPVEVHNHDGSNLVGPAAECRDLTTGQSTDYGAQCAEPKDAQ